MTAVYGKDRGGDGDGWLRRGWSLRLLRLRGSMGSPVLGDKGAQLWGRAQLGQAEQHQELGVLRVCV
jgi:hypothetical protein